MSLVDLSSKFNEIRTLVDAIKFADVQLPKEFQEAFLKYISENTAGGYSNVEWADYSAKILTSTGRSIYLPNYWFYLASELSGLFGGLIEQKELFEIIFKGQDLNSIAKDLRDNSGVENKLVIKSYFNSNDYSNEDYTNFVKYVSDYSTWGGGKTIDRSDFFISPLMKAGNLLAETQGAVAEIAECFYKSPELLETFSPIFVSPLLLSNQVEVKTNLALVQNKSVGIFVYGLIDFLLKNNIESPLFDYLVEKNSEHGSHNVEYKSYRLTSFFKMSDTVLNNSDLIRGDKVRFFSTPFELNSKFYYLSNQWTDGTESRLDIQSLIPIFNSVYDEYKIVEGEGKYTLEEVKCSSLVCLPKPFLLLAGISGTGKTRFVREQARATDSTLNNYCLVPVRPDWHEPSDLLGYTSRLSGHAEYVITDVLTFIVKAWQAVIPVADKDGMGVINDQSIPYWLCLDEMNLAPVEQYFADYLSVLESREFDNDGYQCEALLNKGMLQRLNKTDTDLQSNLGLDGCDDLWQYFLHHGISLPPNLIVAGTVNMDETTHGFSRKVIDRAITLDFGEFFPNVYADYFEATSKPVVFTWSALTECSKESLASAGDVGGAKSIEFLKAVNAVLKRTPFELAYRALNELLLQVACLQPASDSEIQAIWDDFLMTKVLPRIDGDEDKLRSVAGDGEGTLLDDLESTLETNLSVIWNDNRRDYFRLNVDGSNIVDIPCRSKDKLEWMKNRLAINTFTSYWP
jgi:hypothetical protein